jgi:centrosomal protein CEP128
VLLLFDQPRFGLIFKDLYASMAESSSDSDHFRYRDRLNRWAAKSTHRETRIHPAVDVTEKVNTITSTLQVSSTALH